MRERLHIFWDMHGKEILVAAITAVTVYLLLLLGVLGLQNGPRAQLQVGERDAREQDFAEPLTGEILASRYGTRYYFKDCPGLSKIKKENLISFTSAGEAKEAGYLPSKSCLGLDER